MRDAQVPGAVDVDGELFPEVPQEGFPVELAIRDDVELFFEAGGEVIFHVAREEVLQECGDEAAFVFRHQRLAFDADIAAVFQRRHGGGIGGRAADAEFLEPLDQRGFGVAGRGRREGLVGVGLEKVRMLTFHHFGKAAFGVVVIITGVMAFGIELDIAIEDDDLAGRAQDGALVPRGEVDGRAFKQRRFHLGGHRAAPDEGVEFLQVAFAVILLGAQVEVGRAHGLVGLLRVLRLRRIAPRVFRQVACAIVGLDHCAGGDIGLLGHVDAVGPHVGDAAFLIEFLGGLHRALSIEAELAARFLLQR